MAGPTILEAVRQKLLDMNGQLKDIAGDTKPCHLTSRPASARARPATAPGLAKSPLGVRSRPQSARSARSVTSAPAAAPPTPRAPEIVAQKVQLQAVPAPAKASCGVQQEPILKADFQALLELIGAKAAACFSSFHQCFRRLDADSNGKVEVEEIRDLMRVFHMPESAADQLFEHLDTEKTGSLDFQMVEHMLGSYIKPGYRQAAPLPARRAEATYQVKSEPMVRPVITEIGGAEVDLNKLADIIGTKAKAKYRNTRECFRWLDEAKTGYVTRQECLHFLEGFGYNSTIGHQVYNALLRSGEPEVDVATFLHFFGPHIHPRYEDIAKQKDCRPVPVAAPARVAPVAPVAPVASAVGRLSVDRASTAQCRAPTPGPKMGVNAVVHGFDPGQKVKEDDWSAATTSVGCADAVSSATSSIPVKGGYGHRPSPPTSGQPRRPSGTGMGQAALRQPRIAVPTPPSAPRLGLARPRPHSARMAFKGPKTMPEGLRRSASGHCCYCGRNEQGLISTEMLRISLSQRWGVIA